MVNSREIRFGDRYNGTKVVYEKRQSRVNVFGWYGNAPVRGGFMSLGQFLGALGITAKDCEEALKEAETEKAIAEHVAYPNGRGSDGQQPGQGSTRRKGME